MPLVIPLQTNILELKEQSAALAQKGVKKDSRITTLELNYAQKSEEVTQLEAELKRVMMTLY